MAEYSAPATLTTPGGTITFNPSSPDGYLHDPENCVGLDGAPLRTPMDDRPQTHGGLIHPFFKGARHVTLAGVLWSTSVSGRNTLETNLVNALESIIQADGSYSWTPTGGSLKTLTVRCDLLPVFPGSFLKRYMFGLVAANPVIS